MLGFGTRISYAFRCFFSLLFSGCVPGDVLDAFRPAPVPSRGASGGATAATVAPAAAGDVQDTDRAVQVLALLQRDGRLVDFLREDISGFSDAQVGAAVRDVHANCRGSLEKYFGLEPLLADEEGQPTTVSAPVDPALVKVVGSVTSRDSYRGVVRHRGWRVGRVALPALPPSPGARAVVAPAEVEVA
jgi:hypothetical protein